MYNTWKKWCIFTGQEGRETLAVGKEGNKEGKEDSRADKADKASKADEVDKADVWIPETTGETTEDVAITDATVTKGEIIASEFYMTNIYIYVMALPVMEFQEQGCKTRKIFA
jgi:hypothetical protein